MKIFLIGLLYENGVASRTGLAALLLIVLPMMVLLILTGYLAVSENDFAKYDSYVGAVEWLITVGVGLLGYNKTITLKNNGGIENDK